jgi:hypothetical protein
MDFTAWDIHRTDRRRIQTLFYVECHRMKSNVLPGDLFMFYEKDTKTLIHNVPVRPERMIWSNKDKPCTNIPVGGIALLVSDNQDTITWISKHGMFTVDKDDITMYECMIKKV